MALPADLYLRKPSPGKPLVFLLHGTGGTISHMTDPGSPSLGWVHDFGAPFPPDRDVGRQVWPGIGVWSFQLDDPKDVTSWREFLENRDYGTLTYSQDDPSGLLAAAVAQLAEVVDEAMKKVQSGSFVLIGHSRGGLLIRKFLKDHEGDRTSRISKVITLHTSHQGNRLALWATTLNAAVDGLKSALPAEAAPTVDDALKWLTDIVGMPAFTELASGSGFLDELERDEAALPGVEYYTFGGTSVLFSRILAWVYTVESAIPQWNWPPYQHTITMVEVPGVSPVANSLPNLTDEITEGKGDILVADDTATLPFAVHRTNPLNHAEALWDPALQLEVLALLEGRGGIWS